IDATRRLADANRALADSHEQAATAATDQSSAEQYLDYYLSQLSDSERALYDAVIEFRKRLKEEFQPITDVIIDSFTLGIGKAEELLFNNRVLSGLQKLANGMASSFKDLFDLFSNNRSIDFWVKML